jgi:transposase-like protein
MAPLRRAVQAGKVNVVQCPYCLNNQQVKLDARGKAPRTGDTEFTCKLCEGKFVYNPFKDKEAK